MREGRRPSGWLLAVSSADVLVSALAGLLGNVVTSGELPFGLEAVKPWAPIALVVGLVLVVLFAMLHVVVEHEAGEDASSSATGTPDPEREPVPSRTWLRAATGLGFVAVGLLVLQSAGLVPDGLDAESMAGVALSSAGTVGIVSVRFLRWRRQLRPLPPALRSLLERQREEASSLHQYDYWVGSAPPLLEIYVEQKTEYLLPSPVAARDRDRPRVLTLAQMLGTSPYSLVLAEPGVGKSTAVARVLREQGGWWLAARRSSRPENAPYGSAMPIALPADLHGCASLPEAMARECELATGRDPGRRLFEGAPPGARSWLLLIDGIDHILVTRKRTETLARLGGWIAGTPSHHRFMITTRPLLHGEIGLLGAELVGRYMLQRFDQDGLREFAAQWVAYRRSHHVPGLDEPITVERFMASVASASLSSLARVPLIATITALILEWSQEAALPTSRAGLYEAYVQHLLASRRPEDRPSVPQFMAAGAPGRRAWAWLRENLREILEGTADLHLSPDTPGVAECAMRWIEDNAPDGLFAAVPGWRGALPRILRDTSLITPGSGGLRFTHPSFAEYLAAGPRAETFDLEDWLADAQSPDSRSLALFILARLPQQREIGARPVADTLVELLLQRGGAETCVAGAIVADGIQVGAALRLRVVDELVQRLAREDQTTPEALRVLIDLTTDRAILDRLTAFAEAADNPSWMRADIAEELCGVARETGIRLLRRVLATAEDPGLRYRILLLLDGFGAATAEERDRAARYEFDLPNVDTSSRRAGQWYRQIADNDGALPRYRLYALVAIALRREPDWEDQLADVIVDPELAPRERLEAARTVARIADPDGGEPRIVTRFRRIADAAENSLDVRVPLLAALAAQQDRLARTQLGRLARTGGTEFRARFPFVDALRIEVGTRSSEREGDASGGVRPPGRVPQVWGRIPPRNKNFTGREDLLDELESRLRPAGAVAMLDDRGGVGKTSLAVEYAHRHSSDYDVVWWIPADQPTIAKSSIAALAQHLGLPHMTVRGIEETAAAVIEDLRLGNPFARWLLIFDNAGSPEDLAELIPNGPGDVLITSRNPRWREVADSVTIDVMTRQESVDFLHRRVRHVTRQDDAERLADILGDLPLALEQAAALLAETGMSPDEYLRLLEEQTSQPLGERRSREYPQSMTAAWTLALTTLRDKLPEAVDLLHLLAFFGPEPIPREIFSPRSSEVAHQSLGEELRDPIGLSRAMGELTRFALARIDATTRTIQVHRLIQALVRDELPEEDQRRIRRAARLLLADHLRPDPDDIANWSRYHAVLGHIGPMAVEESEDEPVRAMALNVVRYLYASGDYASARTVAERLVRAWGGDDLNLLAARRLLGEVLRASGEYADAHELDTETLATLETVVGPEHPLTLDTMVGVAANSPRARRFAAARLQDTEALARFEEIHGSDDVRTIRVLNRLALDLSLNSDYTAARTHYERAFTLGRSKAPAAQLVALESGEGLTRALRLSGGYVEAVDLGEDAHANAVEELGADHPLTLRIAKELAITWRLSGDYERSRELAREVHGSCVRILGSDHPETLAAATALTNVLRVLGELDTAAELATDTHGRYQVVYGAEHPYTHGTLGNLAILHRFRDDLPEARRCDEEALGGLEAKLGRDHHFTLTVATNLATDLDELGELDSAVRLGRGTLRRLRAVLGEYHPATLSCAANLARSLIDFGENEEGRALLEEVTDRYRLTFGLDHPEAHAVQTGIRVACDFDPPPI